MSSDGIKLLAPGAVVVLKDGVARRLILDMEALVVIEERMGSLDAYLEGLLRRYRGKVITATLAGLTGGLSYLRDDLGRPAYSPQRVASLMDFQSVKDYITALNEAFNQNMPDKGTKRGKGSGRARGSRGKNSIGEPPSTTAEARVSSGA